MSRITLAETSYSLIEEGEHIFKIVKVEYKEDFDKMIVTCETQEGKKQIERFMLNDEGGNKAFSYLAKTALNNFTIEEIDEQDLVGCYFVGTVEHTELESKNNPGKMVTFANIKKKEPVDDDFEGWEVAQEEVSEETDDLYSLLD